MKQLRPEDHDPEKKTGRFRTLENDRKTRADKITLPDNFLSQLEAMAGIGLNGSEIALILGMSRATFERRKQENPEVTEALRRGRAKAKAKVHQTAFQMATSGECSPMTMFWLKARSGWVEKQMIALGSVDDLATLTEDAMLEKIECDEAFLHAEAEAVCEPMDLPKTE